MTKPRRQTCRCLRISHDCPFPTIIQLQSPCRARGFLLGEVCSIYYSISIQSDPGPLSLNWLPPRAAIAQLTFQWFRRRWFFAEAPPFNTQRKPGSFAASVSPQREVSLSYFHSQREEGWGQLSIFLQRSLPHSVVSSSGS
jgi:hypothetical protein